MDEQHTEHAVTAVKPADRTSRVSSLILLMAVLGGGTLLLCAGLGYLGAKRIDTDHIEAQRSIVRDSVAEMRTLVRPTGVVDSRIVRLLEQSAGISDLKFSNEQTDYGRETQPVIDADGRIVGFLTWTPQYPLTRLAETYAPVIGGIALLLALIAAIALLQLRRSSREIRKREELARRAAEFDMLTGLPTEHVLLERLGTALSRRDIQQVVSYAVIELDGINEAHRQLGAKGGDDLLIAVAESLAESLPDTAMLGRGGGDRFVVLMPENSDTMQVLRAAIQAISKPHWLDGVVRISAHAGFAQAPRDAIVRDELARAAFQALRAAARKGSGSVVGFDRSLEAVSAEIQFIRNDLPRAMTAGDLELHYQPIVTPDGTQITGVEALLRWTHPVRGAIPPSSFVPVAEQMGLMDKLGEFVLRRALQDAKRWPQFYISVNLSPVQVRDKSIVDMVRHALVESGIKPSRLMLEITEGVLVENPDEMIQRIEDLRALGVKIALDDFGSGYSNLGYLQRFPIDKLKIDRAFVTPLGKTANAGVIIQAIVALGRALGLKILVEGVETDEQRVLLRMAGCDEMQGFLFARPVPAKSIDKLVSQRDDAKAAQPAESSVLTA